MGFFKNIFKRKKGGTFVGNLIRGVASTATGGVLGNGAQLRAWEAKQEAEKMKGLEDQIAQLRQQNAVNARAIGSDLAKSAIANGSNGQTDPNAGEHVVLVTLKKWWWAVLLVFAAFGGLIYMLTNRQSGGRNSNKRLRLR